MPKVAKELGARAVSLLGPGVHAVGGVAGLHLQVTQGSGRSWLLRYQFDGKRPEMGLGPYPEVTLADARLEAAKARKLLREGVDPLAEREAERTRQRPRKPAARTFALVLPSTSRQRLRAGRIASTQPNGRPRSIPMPTPC